MTDAIRTTKEPKSESKEFKKEDVSIVKDLSLTKFVGEHPLAAVGVAAGVGFLVVGAARLIQTRGSSASLRNVTPVTAALDKIRSLFGREIDQAKSVLVGAALKAVANKIKKSAPDIASQVDEMEEAIWEKTTHLWRPQPY